MSADKLLKIKAPKNEKLRRPNSKCVGACAPSACSEALQWVGIAAASNYWKVLIGDRTLSGVITSVVHLFKFLHSLSYFICNSDSSIGSHWFVVDVKLQQLAFDSVNVDHDTTLR